MKAYVVMGNDYPDAVFTDQAKADEYVARKQEEDRASAPARELAMMRPGKFYRVYWRHYEFEVTE